MNGNVFKLYEEQHNRRQYAKTMEALEAFTNKNLKYSEDLVPLFANPMANPEIQEPDNIAEGATEMKRMIFAEEVKEFVRRTRFLKSNLATVHTVIWGQCSEDMKSKVKTHIVGYKEKVAAHDCAWLLKQIKLVTLQFDVSWNAYLSLLDAQESFLRCRQTHGQTIKDYVYAMQGWAETIESHGGSILGKIDEGNERSTEERKAIARKRTLAIALIRRADTSLYGMLITSLSNDYAMGRTSIPPMFWRF